MGEEATYDMQDNSAVLLSGNSKASRRKKAQERRRNRNADNNQYHYYAEREDCGHSLTYSSSSCASGASMDSSIGDGLRLVEIENIDVADPMALSALLKKGEALEHHRVSSSSRRGNQSR